MGALQTAVDWVAEARYPDQAWEIEVPLRAPRFAGAADVAALVADFHAAHQDVFAVSDPHSPIEAVGWSAEVRCRVASADPGRLAAGDGRRALPSRRVRFAAGWCDAPVHRFESLPDGAEIAGPAMVESGFTSIVLDPGARAVRDALGSLIIEVTP